MPPSISEMWANAFGRFEEESKKVMENLRRNVQRARDRADAERILREAYERMERNLSLFPSAKEIDKLSDRIDGLADRISELETQHGVRPKKKAKKKSSGKKSKKKKKKKTATKKKSGSKSKSKTKSKKS